jgi:hypothetical protein
MESNFNNREFEHYVKSNADQYRMIPSEKVWRSINNSLHTRRRWYLLGLSVLAITVVSVTWVMVSYPTSKKQNTALAHDNLAATSTSDSQPGNNRVAVPDNTDNLTFKKYSAPGSPVPSSIVVPDQLPIQNSELIEQSTLPIENNSVTQTGAIIRMSKAPIPPMAENKDFAAPVTGNTISNTVDIIGIEPNSFHLAENKTTQHNNQVTFPLTIESVTNSFQAEKLVKKLAWEVYFTPTISYRKLSLNHSYTGTSPFSATNYPFASIRDINSEVVHKPDMGIEVGVSTGYPVSKNLKLTGGLQFNINRYDIKAFAYYGEQATINLNGGNNSLTAWTFYRNHDGYKSDWLKNYYFSVSAPIGAKVKVLGNKKTYLGVAGTVQPTYILKDRAFLISSDYKNYVEVPRLIRHVNVNTSFETFVSYASRTGKIRWQVGPQVRYQILSSYKNPYPVRENLFDFGLKLGVSRNK